MRSEVVEQQEADRGRESQRAKYCYQTLVWRKRGGVRRLVRQNGRYPLEGVRRARTERRNRSYSSDYIWDV